MSNPTGTGSPTVAQSVKPLQTNTLAKPLDAPTNAVTSDTSQVSDTVLLKAKRSFTAAPLQRDVRVVAKGEEFEATPDFAAFAIAQKWVLRVDAG